jgi:uncharacterized protein
VRAASLRRSSPGRGRGTAKSGRSYNNTYCIVSRISDGKVREMTDYVDTESITSALFG